MKEKYKIFYGWWVVLVITILLFCRGAAPFAVVLKQLMVQFHTGRGEVSLSQSNIEYMPGPYRNISSRVMNRPQPRKPSCCGFYNQRVVHAAH